MHAVSALKQGRESPERLTKPLVRNAEGANWNPQPGSTRYASQPKKSRRFATIRAAGPSARLARTSPPTKRITCCRSSPAQFSAPTTSTTNAPRITRPLRAPWQVTRARRQVSARQQRLRRSCSSAATLPRSTRYWHGICAPTCGLIAPGRHRHFRRSSNWSGKPRQHCCCPRTAIRLSPITWTAATTSARRYWPRICW